MLAPCCDVSLAGDLGHKVMADLVVYLIQQTAVDLNLYPLNSADRSTFLPQPMYGGEFTLLTNKQHKGGWQQQRKSCHPQNRGRDASCAQAASTSSLWVGRFVLFQ